MQFIITPLILIFSECGKLSAPRYGKVNIMIGEDKISEIATFSCVPGYYVSGSSTLRCERGEWDGHEPECKREQYIYVACTQMYDWEDFSPKLKSFSVQLSTVAHQKLQPMARWNLKTLTTELEHTISVMLATSWRDMRAEHAHRVVSGPRLFHSVFPQLVSWSYSIENACTKQFSVMYSFSWHTYFRHAEVACPLPFIPRGGYLPDEPDLKINGIACGEDVRIRCYSGYQLIGARTATCNPDGTYFWHGSIPRCRNLRYKQLFVYNQ